MHELLNAQMTLSSYTMQWNLHDVLRRIVDGERRKIALHHRIKRKRHDRPPHGTSGGGLCGDVRKPLAKWHARALRNRGAPPERSGHHRSDLERLSLLRLTLFDGPSRLPCYLLHLFSWLSIGSGSRFLLRWSSHTKPKAGNVGEAVAGEWRLVGARVAQLLGNHHHGPSRRLCEVLGCRLRFAAGLIQAQNGEDFREAEDALTGRLVRWRSFSYTNYIVMCWIKVRMIRFMCCDWLNYSSSYLDIFLSFHRRLCVAGYSGHVILFKFRKQECLSDTLVLEIPITYENTDEADVSPECEFIPRSLPKQADSMENEKKVSEARDDTLSSWIIHNRLPFFPPLSNA